MNKKISYLQPVIITILIILCFYLLNQIQIQNSRIDTLTKNLFDIASYNRPSLKEHAGTQFKEDFYLNQLSNSTTLIIGVITIIVAIVGLFTFTSYTKHKKEITNELKITEKNIEIIRLDLKNKTEDLEYETYKTVFNIARKENPDSLLDASTIICKAINYGIEYSKIQKTASERWKFEFNNTQLDESIAEHIIKLTSKFIDMDLFEKDHLKRIQAIINLQEALNSSVYLKSPKLIIKLQEFKETIKMTADKLKEIE